MNDSNSINLLPLLSATIRIADIHDSSHESGTSISNFTENRPQNSDGLWMEIATQLIQYLYEEDIEANEGWIGLLPFIEDMRLSYNVPEEDVVFVLNYLATPTRLTSCSLDDEGKVSSKTTKKTALIEKPHHQSSKRARLTDVGRQTILLSQSAQKWLYANHDAEKIKAAIEGKDFGSIPQLCLHLSQSIRGFAQQIRKVLEKPGINELMDSFKQDSERYLDTIKEVQSGVIAAESSFALRETQESFELWMEAHQQTMINEYAISRSLDELLQSVEALSRMFTEFINASTDSKREIVGCVRFDKAAIRLATMPHDFNAFLAALEAVAPWEAQACFPIPEDFVGCIKQQEKKEKLQAKVLDAKSRPSLPTPIQVFMERYREQIIQRLSEGPISISEAVHEGWAEIDESLFAGQLVGVFSCPDWLELPDISINISLKKNSLSARLSNGAKIIGDDILISIGGTNP